MSPENPKGRMQTLKRATHQEIGWRENNDKPCIWNKKNYGIIIKRGATRGLPGGSHKTLMQTLKDT